MRFEINIKNLDNTGDITPAMIEKYTEIMTALISSGGLDGVKSGQTMIHFGPNADFVGVQINYWPWKRRK